jgi:two-component system nitrogen regulation sensor histidine kinase GlnL
MARNLESMLDAVLDGVVLLDADGDVEFLNSEACRILEISSESALSLSIDTVLGNQHSISKLSRTVLASGRAAIEREHPIERRLAEPLIVDVAVSPLLAGHTVDGAVLMLRDCTIRNSLQEMVAQREALLSFGRIAAGIAHEVKNPLGGIRGAAEILAARAQDERSRRAAEIIVRESDRIAHLVDDFMVFAQGEELRLSQVNIHRVLDEVLALVSLDPLSAGIQIEREFDPSIPELLADSDRLEQVFLNLVNNALQAMEEAGGTLVISTRMSLDHRLSSSDGRHLPTVLVELSDSGPGIEPSVLENLATPFFTTRVGGTGLGLAVARHWVTRHEGTLRLDSGPSLGTTARVALPLRRSNP